MTCPKFTIKWWDQGGTHVLKTKSHIFSFVTQPPLEVSVSKHVNLCQQYLSPLSPSSVCNFYKSFSLELPWISHAVTENMKKPQIRIPAVAKAVHGTLQST